MLSLGYSLRYIFCNLPGNLPSVPVIQLFQLVITECIMLDVVCFKKSTDNMILSISFLMSGQEILANLDAETRFDLQTQLMLFPLRYIDEVFFKQCMVPRLDRQI